MVFKRYLTILHDENGSLSSGIERFLIVVVLGLTFAFSISHFSGFQFSELFRGEAFSPLIFSFFKAAVILFLVILIPVIVYFSYLANKYYYSHPLEEKDENLCIRVGDKLKKIVACKILENKTVLMAEYKDHVLYRKSFYRGNKALKTMKGLILDKYKIPELSIDEEKLNWFIQKLNSDEELLNLIKQKLSKHMKPRKISRIFKKVRTSY